MTRNTVTTIQAGLVLVGTIAAWFFVPHQVLRFAAPAILALAGAGLFAIRAYLRRLHDVLAFLESPRPSDAPDALLPLLGNLERRVLFLGSPMDSRRAIPALRRRQSLVMAAGMTLGILAIGCGMITIMEFSS